VWVLFSSKLELDERLLNPN